MSTFITKRAKERGLKKVDAKLPLQLEVKPMDISKAQQKDPSCCAFARACKRSHKVKSAYFFRTTAWLEYDDKIVRYILPPSMRQEIVAFDRARGMVPGRYQMSPPLKSNSMIEVRQRSAARRGRHEPGDTKIQRKIRFVHRSEDIRGLTLE